MDQQVKARLLGSMHAGRLVIVCGAGLSMARPSSLPPAWQVAEACFDEYRLTVDPTLDPALRQNLEALAQHFADLGTLDSVFIEMLVPWAQFAKPPNAGHAAVADFLVTKAAAAALSANYDILIERCGWENGFDFQSSLDGDEATTRARTQGPLLKFHGCATRDRLGTVWAPSQLEAPPVSERIARSKPWMTANLRQKDLLVVGFWSDWEYLNAVLGTVLDGLSPTSVTVVDLATPERLQQKAAALWNLAHAPGVTFTHIQESGADALDELRQAFSINYLRMMLAAGKATFEENSGVPCAAAWLEVAAFDNAALYDLRRDAEGVPAGSPAVRSQPLQCEVLGAFHLMLRRAGAEQTPRGYLLAGTSVRVVNGAGMALTKLKARFTEAPASLGADVVVAPGAIDLPMPANVVRSGQVGSFVRPAPADNWYNWEGGAAKLGL